MEGLFEKIFRALNVVNTSDLVKSKVLSS